MMILPQASKGSTANREGHGCRLGITARDKAMSGSVGPMGSSPYILVFEGSGDEVAVHKNPGMGHGSQGGVITAEAMIKIGVDVVITGSIGKISLNTLKGAGIRVHGGCNETVGEAMKKCLRDELPECQHAVFAGFLGI
jgi:predicted Fe-Mo cluster-binding NifX family protein